MKPENQPLIPSSSNSTVLFYLKIALENVNLVNRSIENINLKELKNLNVRTLECQYYTKHKFSSDIKSELNTTIGIIYGFLNNEFFENANYDFYAVRAFNELNEELMYVITPFDVAKAAASGNPIEWIKGSVFQENTNDYRLAIAKKQISEIEIALREVIKYQLNSDLENWFENRLGKNLQDQIKSTYENQFGISCSDGNTLVEYTFLLQLKKIICTCWVDFKVIFTDKILFETNLVELNRIRREESHNRFISHSDIDSLHNLYHYFLVPISTILPNCTPVYLIDNWKSNLNLIFIDKLKYSFTDSMIQSESNDSIKLDMIRTNMNALVNYTDEKIKQLENLFVPIQRIEMHNNILSMLKKYKELFTDMIKQSHENNLNEVMQSSKILNNLSLEIHELVEVILTTEH